MNIILWYNKRIMESPIGSAQRAEWIKIKREIEGRLLSGTQQSA